MVRRVFVTRVNHQREIQQQCVSCHADRSQETRYTTIDSNYSEQLVQYEPRSYTCFTMTGLLEDVQAPGVLDSWPP